METKQCCKCGNKLPKSEFHKHRNRKDGLQTWCKSCVKEHGSDPNRKTKATKRALNAYYRMKNEIFDILGRKCARCGFGDVRALQIDHVSGGGRKHLNKHPGTHSYYKSILEELKTIPESGKKYQTLCANCNAIKRIENKEFRIKK